MMVEIKLSVSTINADHLLPMIVKKGTLVMLNQFELVGESPSDDQLILTTSIVGSDFLSDQPLVVLIEGDSFDEAIDLATLRENLNFAFSVESCLLTVRAHVVKLVFVNKKFW